MEEVWRDINDFEGLYQVSNFGRVRSIDRDVTCSNGVVKRFKGKILKISKAKPGSFWDVYRRVKLCKHGKYKAVKIHRIVAVAFVANPNNRLYVNHKNGIKTDNYAENLEWVTSGENQKHGYKLGLCYANPLKGEDHPSSKLRESDVLEIRRIMNESSMTIKELARLYGVSPTLIGHIKRGTRWKHILYKEVK
jgi:hypothetical protein